MTKQKKRGGNEKKQNPARVYPQNKQPRKTNKRAVSERHHEHIQTCISNESYKKNQEDGLKKISNEIQINQSKLMKRKQQKLGKNKHQRGKWYEIKPRKNANEPLYTIQDKKKKT